MSIDLSKLSLSLDRPTRRVNILFIGHVDAGKSTVCGRILVDLGLIDRRTLEKYREQSAEMNRASWYLSWCMDINPEERARGKTTEVGTASVDLPHTRLNILDAPGHKQFINEMIDAASRADVGILIVSARTSEFESGFQGGQTKEHLLLLRAAGVERLVVLVNKMDTCEWNPKRYSEITSKIRQFAKGMYPDPVFIPADAHSGANITARAPHPVYDGPALLEFLDSVDIPRPPRQPCLAVTEKVRAGSGVVLYALCEAPGVMPGVGCHVLPLLRKDRVVALATEDDVEVTATTAGELYKLRLESGAEDVHAGMRVVLAGHTDHAVVSEFYAQLVVLEVKTAVTVGYAAIIHIGQQAVAVKVRRLLGRDRRPLRVARRGERVVALLSLAAPLAVAVLAERPCRFSIRDEGLTVALGVVKKVCEPRYVE